MVNHIPGDWNCRQHHCENLTPKEYNMLFVYLDLNVEI